MKTVCQEMMLEQLYIHIQKNMNLDIDLVPVIQIIPNER